MHTNQGRPMNIEMCRRSPHQSGSIHGALLVHRCGSRFTILAYLSFTSRSFGGYGITLCRVRIALAPTHGGIPHRNVINRHARLGVILH